MNQQIELRKTVVMLEDVWHDGGSPLRTPLRKGVIAAVIRNPHAGRYIEDLTDWMTTLATLGEDLAGKLLARLSLPKEDIQSFGKGAIVGVDGEMEHAAVWHAPGGAGLKGLLGVKGFVTAGQIMGPVGARLHIPLVSVHSPWVRSHFDAVDISIADAPRPGELVFALAMSSGPRVHARIGGVTFEQAVRNEGPKF
jgi:hypothetical protein